MIKLPIKLKVLLVLVILTGVYILNIVSAADEKANIVNLNDSQYVGLNKRVNEYYKYEADNDWIKAYEFRSPEFKNSVNLDVYTKQMEKDSLGWKLAEYKILTAIDTGDNVMLEISFIENITPESEIWEFMKGKHDKLSFKDYSVWKKVDGEWYCITAGVRTHLSLNASFEG